MKQLLTPQELIRAVDAKPHASSLERALANALDEAVEWVHKANAQRGWHLSDTPLAHTYPVDQ
jgi:hypothetical protein